MTAILSLFSARESISCCLEERELTRLKILDVIDRLPDALPLSPNLVEEDKTWVTLERRGNGTLHSLRGIPTKWFLLHDPMMTRLLGSAANLDVLIWVQCHQSNWKPTQRLTSLIMVMNSGRLFGALVVADIAYFFRGLFRGPRKLVDLIFVHALIGVNAMKFNVVSIHC